LGPVGVHWTLYRNSLLSCQERLGPMGAAFASPISESEHMIAQRAQQVYMVNFYEKKWQAELSWPLSTHFCKTVQEMSEVHRGVVEVTSSLALQPIGTKQEIRLHSRKGPQRAPISAICHFWHQGQILYAFGPGEGFRRVQGWIGIYLDQVSVQMNHPGSIFDQFLIFGISRPCMGLNLDPAWISIWTQDGCNLGAATTGRRSQTPILINLRPSWGPNGP